MSKANSEQKALTKIQEYMLEQNRPYSAIDVFTNLKQEFGKTLVVKALESSVSSGVLKDKVIGKQKIFYANQDKLEKYDDNAVADCDSKINALSEQVKSLAAQNKEIQNGTPHFNFFPLFIYHYPRPVELSKKLFSLKLRSKRLLM
ncbi:ous-pairing protein 2, partial [Trichostrongylus colubriformis]